MLGFIGTYQQQVVCAEYFWILYVHVLFEVQEIFVFEIIATLILMGGAS